LIENKLDKDAVMHVCGYGQVDEDLAVTSGAGMSGHNPDNCGADK